MNKIGHYSALARMATLRAETTMTLRWIADRLQIGGWTYVSNLLRENK